MNIKDSGRRVVIVGAGLVGMSYAYALLNQRIADDLTLIDIDRRRVEGEAMDLNHGLAFSGSNMHIRAGDYSDCDGADLVVLTAGVPQRQGEDRMSLLRRNAEIFREVVDSVVESGFNGVFLVATNPVDIMAQLTAEYSGFPTERVIGSGTTLDTARLRYLLGGYFAVDPRNVHAYVIGEHGDSEFVPWSQAMVSTKPIMGVIRDNPDRYSESELTAISDEVRSAAYRIIEAKRATYYGIGMALSRITRAIFGDEHSVLTVSSMLYGEYGESGIYVGSPCIIGRGGVEDKIELDLSRDERNQFSFSCSVIRENLRSLAESFV